MTASPGDRGARDHGQVTVFVVIVTTALIFVLGLVYDGGNLLAARRAASNEAAQAARAGAQSLDEDDIRSGIHDLDPTRAEAAARAFVTEPGHRVTDVQVAGRSIRVTVEIEQRLFILVGGSKKLTGTATACTQRGISQADDPTCPAVP